MPASWKERRLLYDIPIYLDQTRGIVLNPFIEYLKSALQIVTRNFTYESVFHYIRSGLADFTPEEADLLENYVLATGVREKRDGRRFLCAKRRIWKMNWRRWRV